MCRSVLLLQTIWRVDGSLTDQSRMECSALPCVVGCPCCSIGIIFPTLVSTGFCVTATQEVRVIRQLSSSGPASSRCGMERATRLGCLGWSIFIPASWCIFSPIFLRLYTRYDFVFVCIQSRFSFPPRARVWACARVRVAGVVACRVYRFTRPCASSWARTGPISEPRSWRRSATTATS